MANKYDVLIVGGGPAGFTAAIFASRRNLKTLVLAKSLGGQITRSFGVENYPGFLKIPGTELMTKFSEQAEKNGAEIKYEEVLSVAKKGGGFEVKTKNDKYSTKTVILAYGKTPRDLGIKGEEEYAGKGVFYCATCDMPIMRNKTIAVIGGGSDAVDAATFGAGICKKVYLIYKGDELAADLPAIERLKKMPYKEEEPKKMKNHKKLENKASNVEILLNHWPTEVKGNKFVKSLVVQDVNSKQTRDIQLDGVFVEIGFIVKTEMVSKLVKLDNYKQVVTDKMCRTSMPGIFAAGDITDLQVKQAVASSGEGCKAALAAYLYIQEKLGKKTRLEPDWT
jgi:thioredoxin reductase (NADPH)